MQLSSELIQGSWIGELKIKEWWEFIKVHFTMEGEEVKATIDFPIKAVRGKTLTRICLESSKVRFELLRDTAPLIFNGHFKDGMILGDVEQGAEQGIFGLVHIAEIEPEILKEYVGIYQLAPNQFIFVQQQGFYENDLSYLEYDTGRVSPLFPFSENQFFSGGNMEITLETRFVKNEAGEVTGMKWYQKGHADQLSTKVKFETDEVSFRNGDLTLSGMLMIPPTGGPHPAVIFIQGSGPQKRDYNSHLAYFLACHGLAVLRYDKRGVGASTGDFWQATFEDFAQDVLAGVQFLQSRDDIHPERIGLYGHSEGGWIAPLAAAQSKDVAFLMITGGPVVTPAQQELSRIEHQLRADGFPEEEIDEAIALQKLRYDFARTNQGWETLQATIQQAQLKNKEWLSYVGASPEDHWRLPHFRRIMDYEPVPALEKVTCPILAIFGELDRVIPGKENRQKMEEVLKKTGHQDYTLKILPRANHSFWVAETGGRKEYLRLNRFVPELFSLMTNWISERVDGIKSTGE